MKKAFWPLMFALALTNCVDNREYLPLIDTLTALRQPYPTDSVRTAVLHDLEVDYDPAFQITSRADRTLVLEREVLPGVPSTLRIEVQRRADPRGNIGVGDLEDAFLRTQRGNRKVELLASTTRPINQRNHLVGVTRRKDDPTTLTITYAAVRPGSQNIYYLVACHAEGEQLEQLQLVAKRLINSLAWVQPPRN